MIDHGGAEPRPDFAADEWGCMWTEGTGVGRCWTGLESSASGEQIEAGVKTRTTGCPRRRRSDESQQPSDAKYY